MIYLANWASPKLHGSGRKLGIMAKPRAWERGDGTVPVFVPGAAALEAYKAGNLGIAAYREAFERAVLRRASDGLSECGTLARPAVLLENTESSQVFDSGDVLLRDGDTLLCCCARLVAAQGKCHRVWTAKLLRQAGWQVTLDGVLLETECNF